MKLCGTAPQSNISETFSSNESSALVTDSERTVCPKEKGAVASSAFTKCILKELDALCGTPQEQLGVQDSLSSVTRSRFVAHNQPPDSGSGYTVTPRESKEDTEVQDVIQTSRTETFRSYGSLCELMISSMSRSYYEYYFNENEDRTPYQRQGLVRNRSMSSISACNSCGRLYDSPGKYQCLDHLVMQSKVVAQPDIELGILTADGRDMLEMQVVVN